MPTTKKELLEQALLRHNKDTYIWSVLKKELDDLLAKERKAAAKNSKVKP